MWTKMEREGSWRAKAVAAGLEEVRRRKKGATVAWATMVGKRRREPETENGSVTVSDQH